MKRTMTEVRTFNVKLYCDCGGELMTNGVALETTPPVYPHVCNECGTTEVITGQTYPTTSTNEVGEPQEITPPG